VDEVTITPLPLTHEFERGRGYLLRTRMRDDFALMYRKAGTVSGNHIHMGGIPEKNPEVVVFVQGTAKFRWEGRDGKTREETVDYPAKAVIQPGVWHEIFAVTDIVFMEEGWLTMEVYEGDTTRRGAR
jgi:hypothetical protein